MKNWKKFQIEDFEEMEWGDRLVAKVEFCTKGLYLDIPEVKFATNQVIHIFKNSLKSWQDNGRLIASLTEDCVQNFLPGRKVEFNDLSLWQLGVIDSRGQLSEMIFRYNLEGDYSNVNYDLDQFDSRSTIELQLPIINNDLVWDDPYMNTTNDYD